MRLERELVIDGENENYTSCGHEELDASFCGENIL
jgi:hypothetical protein